MKHHGHFLPNPVYLCQDQTKGDHTPNLCVCMCERERDRERNREIHKMAVYILPVSGTSVGLAIDLICSKSCKSGDNPVQQIETKSNLGH